LFNNLFYLAPVGPPPAYTEAIQDTTIDANRIR